MRVFTVHTRPQAAPVLVPERFSWGAAIFGPLWLWARRAWIAGIIALCAGIATGSLAPQPWRWALSLALAALLGLFGQDLRRWSLGRRGYVLAHVVAARDRDEALARLLASRPDLTEAAAR